MPSVAAPFFLSAIHFHVSDPAKIARFFERFLGCKFETGEYGWPEPYLFVDINETRLTLHGSRGEGNGRGGSAISLAFDVPDLSKVAEIAAQEGLRLTERRLAPGVRAVALTMEEGAEITLVQHPSWWYLRIEALRARQRSVLRRWRRQREAGSVPGYGFHWLRQAAKLRLNLLRRKVRFGILDPAAYATDRVAIDHRELDGFTHLVSSREGLFAINETCWKRVFPGQFFGLSWYQGDIYVFQALGPQGVLRPRGRILRLRMEASRVAAVEVSHRGLDNGCHQIDFVGERLIALETYRQRVWVHDRRCGETEVRTPLGVAAMRDWKAGYCHINSVVAHQGEIYLLKHNDTIYTGRNSELVRCDERLQVLETKKLIGGLCHDIVFLEDGRCLICDSMGGRVIDADGQVVLDVGSAAFLRGLSVDQDSMLVGESDLADRRTRQLFSSGRVHFYDRDYRRRGVLELPAAVLDICRIDGQDLSLSNYRSGLKPAMAAAG